MIANSLKKGDLIALVAPSGTLNKTQKNNVRAGVKKLLDDGFKIMNIECINNIDEFGVSAGNPKKRAEDINNMFSNKDVKAIYSVQGGETVNEILNHIDFEIIKKNPKIFLGMSDIDVLHLAINTKTNLIVFNSSDPKSNNGRNLDFEYTWNSFHERLILKSRLIKKSSSRKCIRKGIAEGKIIGCNLPSILKLSGKEYFPDFKDSILFIEAYKGDIRDTISRLTELKQLGVFDKIKGIVIGHIYEFQNKKQKHSFEDIVLKITKDYNFPILKTNDFGHKCPNCFLPIGAKVKVDATNKIVELTEDFLN